MPIILHNRESHADMIALLKEHGAGVRGVFHCFIGDQAMAQDALDLGFYLSFAGPLTYPANETLREVAAWAPEDRILVETDSPYLTPPPHRGKRNEPKQVALVAQRLAEARKVSLERIAAVTTQNAADACSACHQPPHWRSNQRQCACSIRSRNRSRRCAHAVTR